MTCGVYALFDDVTDECLYVGLSKEIHERWKGHLKLLKNGRHRRTEFVIWFRDHGNDPSSIRWKILEECLPTNLNEYEIKWTNLLKPIFSGKTPSLNNKWEHSEKTKKNISRSLRLRGIRNTDITIEKNGCIYLVLNCKNDKTPHTFTTTRRDQAFCSKDCYSEEAKNKYETRPTFELLQKLYVEEGMSTTQISKVLKCSQPTVLKHMKSFGIKSRNRASYHYRDNK